MDLNKHNVAELNDKFAGIEEDAHRFQLIWLIPYHPLARISTIYINNFSYPRSQV